MCDNIAIEQVFTSGLYFIVEVRAFSEARLSLLHL